MKERGREELSKKGNKKEMNELLNCLWPRSCRESQAPNCILCILLNKRDARFVLHVVHDIPSDIFRQRCVCKRWKNLCELFMLPNIINIIIYPYATP